MTATTPDTAPDTASDTAPNNIILITDNQQQASALADKIQQQAQLTLSEQWILPLNDSLVIDPANTLILFAGSPQTCIEIQHLARQIPTFWLTSEADEFAAFNEVLSLRFVGYINLADLHALKPIIKQGIFHFHAQEKLHNDLKELHTRLEDRKQIERAKGLLMQKHHYNESEAYIFLRKLSMDRAQKMGQIAKELLEETAQASK